MSPLLHRQLAISVAGPAPAEIALHGLIQAASFGEAHLHRAYTSLAHRVAAGLPISVTEVERIRHVHADLSAALAAYDKAAATTPAENEKENVDA